MRKPKPKSGSRKEHNLLSFIAEAGMLKRVERSGWPVVGIKHAESVAEHSFRCAVIGYILAHLENARVPDVIIMTLFGDLHEARISDLHKMAQHYLPIQKAETDAFMQQCDLLPKKMRNELLLSRRHYLEQKTKESIIARDADILECLIQAKEYLEHGYTQAAQFMKKAPKFLKTKSARQLWKQAQQQSLNEWWFHLSDFVR